MTTYTIYVPAPGTAHDIRPASAIVGEEREGVIHTHYEGGGASNVQTFEDRLTHAAGRRRERYPTSTMRAWPVEALVAVGTAIYDETLQHWVVGDLADEAAFAAWLGDEPVPAVGGSRKVRGDAAGRAFGRLDPGERARIVAMGLPRDAMVAETLAVAGRRGI